MARIGFLSLFNNLPILGNRIDQKMVSAVELKPPDNVGGVFNVAGFFEGFKRNALRIVETVERADDNESGVGLPLKVFELANNFINSLFGRNVGVFDRNDLKIVKNEDRSFIFAEWTKFKNQVVDVVFLKFEDVKVKIGRFKLGNNVLKVGRCIAAPNTGRS